ncbi:PTS sugar transporter subunit IIA [Tepidibacter formicigenes]|jgi:glucose-specific phosphotransferase system IIA component|uniref:PTS system IIA component, Glc family (TC 4.A.1) n=1 Tax=Tepidibacter formicigenes DSM 15518 TaxID=1123349 RepID=A0A1M6PJS2_9FIRM|nr:PTS glucose transporter subunit IIA [Tepidibacter formicigenes]SHK08167.1 PTS system IIA component, Glc family (TC 4.A.1) [Tepidibacter formicigenes DSM 15518]
MFSFFVKNKELIIKAPFDGEIVDITKVNDEAFSSKMLGDGVAVIPSNNIAVAPCDGTITQIFPTNHAFGITTKEGIEILVHIGIDTVSLKGEGFKRLIEVGSKVKKGTPIIEVDLEYIKKYEKDTITPIIITNMDNVESMDKNFNNIEEILKIKVKK